MRGLFIQWWFKYFKYYGISSLETASKHIPITYGAMFDETITNETCTNKKTIITSKLLGKYNENINGYNIVNCPNKDKPCWYYKMGDIEKWDGINLNNFCFCCRLNSSPYC